MTIPLTHRAWSTFHVVAPTRLERVIAILTIFTYGAQMPMVWFHSADHPALNKTYPGYYELIFRVGLLFLAWSAIGWSLSTLVTAMRLEPLIPLFVAWVFASSLWSTRFGETFRDASYLFIVVVFGYWLAIRFSLSDIIGLAATAMVWVVALQVLFIVALPAYGDSVVGWVGTMGNKNSFGRLMALLSLLFVLAARTQRRRRALWWGFAIAAIVLTVGSGSKTGLVAVVGMPAMALVITAFRARRTLYGAIAVTMVAGSGLVTWFGIVNRPQIAAALGKNSRLTGRTLLWSELVPELHRRPLQGFGFGGYWTGWNGPSADMMKRLGWVAGHSHNAFFQLTLDLGLIGFVLMLAITVRLVVRGARVVRWYTGAIGLFPLLFAALTVLISITEYGIVRPDAIMLLFIPACIGAARGRKDVLTFERSHAVNVARWAPPAAPTLALLSAGSSAR
jgi:exopolysaccharide production protein ExoQ